jgi:hypothetical protein
MEVDIERRIEEAVAAIDFDRAAREYREQNELVFIERLFPADIMAELIAEMESLRPAVIWHRIPFVRGGGTIGFRTILARAPVSLAVYRSPAFIGFLSRLVGKELFVKSEDDEQSCVWYFYDRRGDHMYPHYDTCGCEDDASYSIIIGVVSRSVSRLACHLYKDVPGRATKTLEIDTQPGSIVIFNGSKLYHGVTPLGQGEERVVFSPSYMTNSTVKRAARFRENLKDAILYFGLPALLQRNYAWGLKPRKKEDKG